MNTVFRILQSSVCSPLSVTLPPNQGKIGKDTDGWQSHGQQNYGRRTVLKYCSIKKILLTKRSCNLCENDEFYASKPNVKLWDSLDRQFAQKNVKNGAIKHSAHHFSFLSSIFLLWNIFFISNINRQKWRKNFSNLCKISREGVIGLRSPSGSKVNRFLCAFQRHLSFELIFSKCSALIGQLFLFSLFAN